LKYLFIICSSVYIFSKVLNISIFRSTKSAVLLSAYALLLPLAISYLRQCVISLSLIIMAAVSVAVFKLAYGVDFNRTVVAALISYGISYTIYVISLFIVSVVFRVFSSLSYSVLFVAVAGWIQLLLAYFLFRVKRLRNGLSFLDDIRYSSAGVFISISILTASSFIGMQQDVCLIYEILTVSIFLCGVALWFWWKNCMTRRYIAQLNERDLKLVNNTIATQQSKIETLQRENEELSKIVHKDNKLIPALALSVRECLDTVAKNEDQQVRVSRTQELLNQLNRISYERYDTLRNYELSSKKLTSCGLPILDMLLSYMLWKASVANIDFDLIVWDSLKSITETVITEQDISTVLADLIENAIIATLHSNSEKRILVEVGLTKVGLTKGHYFISVSDSGVPFSKEVLKNWGIQRITTYADCGGSGIGMMSTYDICKRYGASFFVETFDAGMPYSKRVMICFDDANQFCTK